MSKENLGWLYYKEMYRNGDDENHFRQIFERVLQVNNKDISLDLEHSFTLKTTYPGLIIGSGYTHGISSEEDVKMGFYFDFTSGVPTLPGSSVKGVLRSLFGLHEKERYKDEKIEFIRTFLGKDTLNVKKLAQEIFEGIRDQKPISVSERDKFYEARIVKTTGTILEEDYITPHKDPLKNPNPIKIVKVKGDTEFEFSFELHDSKIDDILVTADEKLALFFQLLQFHGMGAKTNVGYGQFQDKDVTKMYAEKKLKIERKKEELEKQKEEKRILQEEKDKEKALQSADTNVKKIAIAIVNETENKVIHETISSFTLTDKEKQELLIIIEKQIGPKPKPKNKAQIKWAIKVYELLGA